MAKNFSNRRSTPVSEKKSDKLIQDLVIPEFTNQDFRLDSWGKEFETQIDEKLFKVNEDRNKKHKECKKKRDLVQDSPNIVKNQIIESEEAKSSRSSISSAALDFQTEFSIRKEHSKSISKDQVKEVIIEEENTTVASSQEKNHSNESLSPESIAEAALEAATESLARAALEGALETYSGAALETATESIAEGSTNSSTEILDNSVAFNPPRSPMDLDKLILERERLVDELNETNAILRDLNIEGNVLQQDIYYFDQNLEQLSQTCREAFKDFYEKLNKLKLSGYANSYEVDAAKKLTMFFKMAISDTPPNPDLLEQAVEKIFGNESNYFVMPDINTVLAKVQQAALPSNKNIGGSRMNLKGSSSNLRGSARNLRGSAVGLGDWNSNMELTNQSVMELLIQK
jgi:hypothetical protein